MVCAEPVRVTCHRHAAHKKDARRTLKEIGASASGILLNEQSTPRHKDLKAGIRIRSCSPRTTFVA